MLRCFRRNHMRVHRAINLLDKRPTHDLVLVSRGEAIGASGEARVDLNDQPYKSTRAHRAFTTS
eukprot:1274358-Amphidinium_carterae.2